MDFCQCCCAPSGSLSNGLPRSNGFPQLFAGLPLRRGLLPHGLLPVLLGWRRPAVLRLLPRVCARQVPGPDPGGGQAVAQVVSRASHEGPAMWSRGLGSAARRRHSPAASTPPMPLTTTTNPLCRRGCPPTTTAQHDPPNPHTRTHTLVRTQGLPAPQLLDVRAQHRGGGWPAVPLRGVPACLLRGPHSRG